MIRSHILQVTLIITAAIVLSLLYFFYPATNSSLHPKCIFHSITGLYCPGCGSQRAASALLHGHLLTAIDYNILMVLCLPVIIYSAIAFTWNMFSPNKLKQTFLYSPFFAKSLLVIVLAFWVLRNIPIAPFNWLAP